MSRSLLGRLLDCLWEALPGRGGHLLRVALSLILSLSFIVFEQKTGFNLARLGTLALVILLVLFAILVARLLLKSGAGAFPAMWLTYLLWYVLLRFLAPEVHEQMVSALPWLNPLMSWMALSGFAVLGISLLLGHDGDRPGKPRRPKPLLPCDDGSQRSDGLARRNAKARRLRNPKPLLRKTWRAK